MKMHLFVGHSEDGSFGEGLTSSLPLSWLLQDKTSPSVSVVLPACSFIVGQK